MARLAVLVVLAVVCTAAAAEARRQPAVPLVIGHRGTRTAYPENTLPAFQYALSNGADGIESDLRLTADDQIVLLHDATLDRTTNCTGAVADYTLEELQSCDACSWYNASLTCPIPTFNETVQLIVDMAGNQTAVQTAFFIMDLKVESLAKFVRASLSAFAAGTQSRLLASCWTQTQVQDFAVVLPGVVHHRLSNTLPAGWNSDADFWSGEVQQGIRGYSLNYNNFFEDPLAAQFIRAAHSQMMAIVAWTMNEDQTLIRQVIDFGCNSLICDSPVVCQQVVADLHTNIHRPLIIALDNSFVQQ